MESIIATQDRHAVPAWRSFGSTVSLGELSFTHARQSVVLPIEASIDEYIIDFELNKTVIHAAELVNAGIANKLTENSAVKKAAEFILGNQEKSTSLQVALAKNILFPQDALKKEQSLCHEEDLLNYFENRLEKIKQKINTTKAALKAYPNNSILYVELSRYYSILGLEDKAIHAMKIAMHLAKNNRFVLRSATRLFSNYHSKDNDYLEYIQHFLSKRGITSQDPWIMSAEISIASTLSKTSKFIKKGISLIESRQHNPLSFTELASNIATIEMKHGGHKKSRQLFRQALIQPNDNSLAQVEWASRKDHALSVSLEQYNINKNFEALMYDAYFNKKQFDLTLTHAIHWFLDQPYSKDSVMFGSNIAATLLSEQDKAIAFVRAGLISHPNDPGLINNLAYSLALDNRPQESLDALSKIKHSSQIGKETQICLIATQGLALFRTKEENNVKEGVRLYQEAMQKAKDSKNNLLALTAALNYWREVLLYNPKEALSVYNSLKEIPENIPHPSIEFLRNHLMNECLETMKKLTQDSSNKDSKIPIILV